MGWGERWGTVVCRVGVGWRGGGGVLLSGQVWLPATCRATQWPCDRMWGFVRGLSGCQGGGAIHALSQTVSTNFIEAKYKYFFGFRKYEYKRWCWYWCWEIISLAEHLQCSGRRGLGGRGGVLLRREFKVSTSAVSVLYAASVFSLNDNKERGKQK